MITFDLNVLEAISLIVNIVNLLVVIALISYGLGWEKGSRRRSRRT